MPRSSLRLSAALLLGGQLLYIVATLFHPGGEGNRHAAAFGSYAESELWAAVHLGQFMGVAILLAGLLALFFALESGVAEDGWASRFGAAAAIAALVLYGVLQAVDGVALKQAVDAWAGAPEHEKMMRFASAEAIRWLEWGVRSYHDFALGLALLLAAVASSRPGRLSRPIILLMVLSGLAYLVQGWVVGVEGFSGTESLAIVVAWALDVGWMVWLLIFATRIEPNASSTSADRAAGTSRASLTPPGSTQ